jgi:hypothetical protein
MQCNAISWHYDDYADITSNSIGNTEGSAWRRMYNLHIFQFKYTMHVCTNRAEDGRLKLKLINLFHIYKLRTVHDKVRGRAGWHDYVNASIQWLELQIVWRNSGDIFIHAIQLYHWHGSRLSTFELTVKRKVCIRSTSSLYFCAFAWNYAVL